MEGDVDIADEGDGGVVDEDVESSEVLDRLGHHVHHLVVNGQVGGDGQPATTDGFDAGDRLVEGARRPLWVGLRRAGGAGHIAPCFGQSHRGGGTDTAAGSGHQSHFPLEVLHATPSSICRLFGVNTCRKHHCAPTPNIMYVKDAMYHAELST